MSELVLLLSWSVMSNSWTAAHQDSLSFIISWTLLKLMSIESVMPSNHLILCHSLLSYPESFPALGSFPMSQLFTSSGQITGASASASVFSMNIQDWFPLGLTGLVSAVQGTLKSLLQHHSLKASILWRLSFLYSPTLTSIHDYWKHHSLD